MTVLRAGPIFGRRWAGVLFSSVKTYIISFVSRVVRNDGCIDANQFDRVLSVEPMAAKYTEHSSGVRPPESLSHCSILGTSTLWQVGSSQTSTVTWPMVDPLPSHPTRFSLFMLRRLRRQTPPALDAVFYTVAVHELHDAIALIGDWSSLGSDVR